MTHDENGANGMIMGHSDGSNFVSYVMTMFIWRSAAAGHAGNGEGQPLLV